MEKKQIPQFLLFKIILRSALLMVLICHIATAQVSCVDCNNQTDSFNPGVFNFIQNGSFENSTCPPMGGGYYCPNSSGYSCDINNWTCIGGGNATYAQILGTGSTTVPAGSVAAYLGNDFCASCPGGVDGNISCLNFSQCVVTGAQATNFVNEGQYGGSNGVSIYQTINGLIPGNSYILEFWAGGEPGFNNSGAFGVDVGYGYVFCECIPSPVGVVGRRFMITFVANNPSHTILFTNWGHICSTCTEVILDDVSVYEASQASTTPVSCIPPVYVTNPVNLCEGDTYVIGSSQYVNAGTYQDYLITAQGGDSIVTTIITMRENYQYFEGISICEGESYDFNGTLLTTTGIYNDTLPTIYSCDSIFSLILSVVPSPVTQNPVQICPGSSYSINGHTYTLEGSYNDYYPLSAECDSTVITTITYTNLITANNPVSICEGSSYTINGNTYSLAGTYVDTLMSPSGCDSVVTTLLTFSPFQTSTQNKAICEGESITVGSHIYTLAGTYIDTIQIAGGCAQIITTHLETLYCPQIKVPNAFSPNNDGINDTFHIFGGIVQSFTMRIFNRWGQLIFESDNPQAEWDGSYNGKQQDIGVYAYYISGKYPDGNNFELKGNLTLLR